MRGLRRGVDDHAHIRAISLEETCHSALVADIYIVVPVGLELRLEVLPAPGRAGLLAEELAAHVVVNTDDVQSLPGKEPRGLGSYQTCRASDYGNSHVARLFILVSPLPLRGARVS